MFLLLGCCGETFSCYAFVALLQLKNPPVWEVSVSILAALHPPKPSDLVDKYNEYADNDDNKANKDGKGLLSVHWIYAQLDLDYCYTLEHFSVSVNKLIVALKSYVNLHNFSLGKAYKAHKYA